MKNCFHVYEIICCNLTYSCKYVYSTITQTGETLQMDTGLRQWIEFTENRLTDRNKYLQAWPSTLCVCAYVYLCIIFITDALSLPPLPPFIFCTYWMDGQTVKRRLCWAREKARRRDGGREFVDKLAEKFIHVYMMVDKLLVRPVTWKLPKLMT